MNKISLQSTRTLHPAPGNFLLRGVHLADLRALQDLAGQFSLLNLPADRKILGDKIERSIASFAGDLPREESEYLFVVEDLETRVIVGSSLILAKHGTEDTPHYSFQVIKRDRFSDDLGLGFIHNVLRLRETTDGPTEIGGLLVDRGYRRRPERLGRQVSLVRFIYMAMHPERFEENVLCELTPPLGEGGRSEFWEALGRRFTGLPYQEADLISQRNKEFISSLFPTEEIYLALLDSKARLVVGRVGDETTPAQHLLESIGFRYLNEVDPFDGGPHYGAVAKDITLIKNYRKKKLESFDPSARFSGLGLIAMAREGEFFAVISPYAEEEDSLRIPDYASRAIDVSPGEAVHFTPVKEAKGEQK